MLCHTCGFDASLWTPGDLRTTRTAVAALVRQTLDGADIPTRAAMQGAVSRLKDLPEDATVATLHLAMHALHEAGRLRHGGRTRGEGVVVQVNRSGGGVPKTATDRATVTLRGLDGDVQRTRRHHGRPWQAVSLWSAEVIEGLQREGHRIGFGSAGENLTLRGLVWGDLSPGVRLQVGSAVLQVSSYAIPCAKNARWFSDGDTSRMAQEARPGCSRLYASVVVPGAVAPGDAATVEPTVQVAARAEQLAL